MRHFCKNESGATSAEYALVILVAGVGIALASWGLAQAAGEEMEEASVAFSSPDANVPTTGGTGPSGGNGGGGGNGGDGGGTTDPGTGTGGGTTDPGTGGGSGGGSGGNNGGGSGKGGGSGGGSGKGK